MYEAHHVIASDLPELAGPARVVDWAAVAGTSAAAVDSLVVVVDTVRVAVLAAAVQVAEAGTDRDYHAAVMVDRTRHRAECSAVGSVRATLYALERMLVFAH